MRITFWPWSALSKTIKSCNVNPAERRVMDNSYHKAFRWQSRTSRFKWGRRIISLSENFAMEWRATENMRKRVDATVEAWDEVGEAEDGLSGVKEGGRNTRMGRHEPLSSPDSNSMWARKKCTSMSATDADTAMYWKQWEARHSRKWAVYFRKKKKNKKREAPRYTGIYRHCLMTRAVARSPGSGSPVSM